MENVFLIALSQYFIFYVLNYTRIGFSILEPIKKKYHIYKVSENWREKLLYPLFCPLCFCFHFTTLLFLISFFIPIKISIFSFTVGPLIALITDNFIKFLINAK